jgi:hypothetical protein
MPPVPKAEAVCLESKVDDLDFIRLTSFPDKGLVLGITEPEPAAPERAEEDLDRFKDDEGIA